MKRTAVILLLLLLLIPGVSAGEWRGSGSPLSLMANGTVHGTVVTAGGHGYTSEQPYTEYFDLPAGRIAYGAIAVPSWNYDASDTLTLIVNGKELPERTTPDSASAWGVASYLFDVTDLLKTGSNVAEVRYNNQNGAPYAVYLTAVVENSSMPLCSFFTYEGNTALAPATHMDSETVAVDGPVKIAGLENATLSTMLIAGTAGENDRLLFNDRLLGEDVGRAKSGPYLDLDQFDVTAAMNTTGNHISFERGDESYIHPFAATLVLQYANGTSVPETGVTVHSVASSPGRVIPLPVIAVLVLAVLGGVYLYRNRRGRP
jgi:hypothetical protein